MLGPRLLESVEEQCLAEALDSRGAAVRREPVRHEGELLDATFRIDLLVDDRVIVEVKAADALLSTYSAQLPAYLRLAELRLGSLINFNMVLLKDDLKRVINSLGEPWRS